MGCSPKFKIIVGGTNRRHPSHSRTRIQWHVQSNPTQSNPTQFNLTQNTKITLPSFIVYKMQAARGAKYYSSTVAMAYPWVSHTGPLLAGSDRIGERPPLLRQPLSHLSTSNPGQQTVITISRLVCLHLRSAPRPWSLQNAAATICIYYQTVLTPPPVTPPPFLTLSAACKTVYVH